MSLSPVSVTAVAVRSTFGFENGSAKHFAVVFASGVASLHQVTVHVPGFHRFDLHRIAVDVLQPGLLELLLDPLRGWLSAG